jgi:DNA-binding HxlR family transcriptional regulator
MKKQLDKFCSTTDAQEAMLPIFDALDALRGRWRLPILVSLGFGKKRFTQIKRDVTGISDKILAKELKDLEVNQLIKRTVYETFPPSVDYMITDHGKLIGPVVIELKKFGDLHRTKIIQK